MPDEQAKILQLARAGRIHRVDAAGSVVSEREISGFDHWPISELVLKFAMKYARGPVLTMIGEIENGRRALHYFPERAVRSEGDHIDIDWSVAEKRDGPLGDIFQFQIPSNASQLFFNVDLFFCTITPKVASKYSRGFLRTPMRPHSRRVTICGLSIGWAHKAQRPETFKKARELLLKLEEVIR